MSIFIEISGKCYKVPSKITIGRGEPFNQFNDNRSVARTHFCMTVSKGSIYIKDLGTSKEGLSINGKKIKPKTQIKLNTDDEIVFANEKLRILTTAPAEFIEIKKSTAGRVHSFDHYKIITWIPILTSALIMVSNFRQPTFDYSKALATIVVGCFLTFIFRLYVNFLKRVSIDILKEVTFTNEGFTTFTNDNVNMTFALDKIESWTIQKERLLKINAHGHDFEYILDNNFEDFKIFLQKNLAIKKVQVENLRYTRGALFLIFAIGLQLTFEFSNPLFQYSGLGILTAFIIMCAAMLFKKDLRKYWAIRVGKKNSSLFQTGSIITAALYAFMVINDTYSDMKKHELNKTAAASCSEQNKESCLKVDYNLTYLTETEYKNRGIACELGNRTACHGRAPASIKK